MTIDIHTHFIPPSFVDEARRGRALDSITVSKKDDGEWLVHPQGYRYPLSPEFFEVDAKLRQMDGLGIDVSVLSLTPTLFFYWLDAGPTAEFCRLANDAVAQMAAQSGGRLFGMAVVPMQDPEAAATELRRAAAIGLRGVMIGTTIGDVPLDDARFTPFFAVAEELKAPVMLHPYYVGPRRQLGDFYMTNLTGNPLETCLAATRLMLSGFFDRHPGLNVVLVHAGGFMPFQSGRLDHGFRVRSETKTAITVKPSTYLRRFHYDTITHASTPLEFLTELVGVDRVMLGTDLPFDMADDRFDHYLREIGFDQTSLEAITSRNAIALYHLDGPAKAGHHENGPAEAGHDGRK